MLNCKEHYLGFSSLEFRLFSQIVVYFLSKSFQLLL